MKRTALLFPLLLALALLPGCGTQQELTQNTAAPYSLTQDQGELLELLGLSDRAGLVTFSGPEEATVLSIDTYQLRDGEPWEGLAVLQSREDYSIDLRVRTEGIAAYTTDPAEPDSDPQGWTLQFLEEETPITLGEPVPVALFLYSGDGSLRTHPLTDFADPAAFDGEDLALVQAVTLTFTA